MIKTNRNVSNLKPYKLASHKIWENHEGENILKLDWNEATIPASPKVKDAVIKCIDSIGFRFYPDVDNKVLNQELASYSNVTYESVQYFPSSDVAHEYIVRAYIEPGDKVLILGPTYDNFRISCEACGGVITYAKYNDDFEFCINEYSRIISDLNPKVAYICNPNNPTGTQIEIRDIEKVVENNKNTMFIIDEAYVEFSGKSSSELTQRFGNVIVTRTFSKAFALANFRIGYIISSAINIDNINKIRNAKNISSFSQVAALAALNDIEYMRGFVEEVNSIKSTIADELLHIVPGITKVYVGGGNFVLLQFDSTKNKIYFDKKMEEHNIFLRDLSHVERLKNFTRMTIGTNQQMQYVLSKVVEIYEKTHCV